MQSTFQTFLFSLAWLLFISWGTAKADLIDFESGYSDGESLNSVVTSTNRVTFVPSGTTSVYHIAKTGPGLSGFVPDDVPGGPGADRIGDFFLTDETVPDSNLAQQGDYGFYFAVPVVSLSLDTLDYRTDGGGKKGDMVKLEVFSDPSFLTLVGYSEFEVQPGLTDGAVQVLSISGVGPFSSAKISSSGNDVGTGIDNISFETIRLSPPTPTPEPTSFLLWGVVGGAGGLWGARKRWKKR